MSRDNQRALLLALLVGGALLLLVSTADAAQRQPPQPQPPQPPQQRPPGPWAGGYVYPRPAPAPPAPAPPAPAPPAPTVPGFRLSSPLTLPVRRVTPKGGYLAPRFVDGKLDHYHKGLDLAARGGEPVFAVGDGVILPMLRPGRCKLGLILQLDGSGNRVVYCDLGSVAVSPGERVVAGQTIARVDPSEGFVHVSIRAASGQWLDPRPWFPHR